MIRFGNFSGLRRSRQCQWRLGKLPVINRLMATQARVRFTWKKRVYEAPYSAAMPVRLLTDHGNWNLNNMPSSQKNDYSTIEMVSRIECKAELLNLMADAPKKNVLNIPGGQNSVNANELGVS